MGGQPKKASWIKLALLSLAIVAMFMPVVFSVQPQREPEAPIAPSGDSDIIKNTTWQGVLPDNYVYPSEAIIGNVYQISDVWHLTYIAREMANGRDFSGCTFKLMAPIDLLETSTNPDFPVGTKVNPIWTPIPVGENGKNINITFDGNNKTISNMRIDVFENAGNSFANVGVGLFSNLIGGTVKNLTFVNPSVNCTYTRNADGSLHPTAPIEVGVGVLAGRVSGTVIQNVKINTPTVNLTSNNFNGHSFYAGAAVGKLADRSVDYNLRATMGVLDQVQVENGSVTLDIKNLATGTATRGYLGGAAGANISGKIINTRIKNLAIQAKLNNSNGTYDAGGLVGFTTMHAHNPLMINVSGLLNNMVINSKVVKDAATVSDKLKIGLIAGKVYGNWVYSNAYFGDIDVGTDVLFGGNVVYNARYNYFVDGCIAYQNIDALDVYFRRETHMVEVDGVEVEESLYPDCKERDTGYIECDKAEHNSLDTEARLFTDEESGSNVNNHNWIFQPRTVGTGYAEFNEVNFNQYDVGGYMYQMAQPIIKYEFGKNSEMLREAVNQFCVWKVDNNGEPSFGSGLGTEYKIVFHANGGLWGNQEKIEIYKKVNEKLDRPAELPTLTGYRMKTGVDGKVNWYRGDGTSYGDVWDFEEDFVGTQPIDLCVQWELDSFHVIYKWKTNENEPEFTTQSSVGEVEYASFIPYDLKLSERVSATGKTFAGWFLEDGFDGDFKDAENECWKFDTEAQVSDEPEKYLMPAEDLVLYAGWIDTSGILGVYLTGVKNLYFPDNEVLDDFNAKAEAYFDEITFAHLKSVWHTAYLAKQADDAEMDSSKKMKLPAIEAMIGEVDNAVESLRFNLKCAPIVAQTSKPLNPQFMYTKSTYNNYLDKKGLLEATLETINPDDYVPLENPYEVLTDLRDVLFDLNEAYKALKENPNLKDQPQATVNVILEDYVEMNVNKYPQAGFDVDMWVLYSNAYDEFKSVFNSDSPEVVKMQSAISDLKIAKENLLKVDVDMGNNNPGQPGVNNDPEKKQGWPLPVSPVILGIVIAVALVVTGGGVIGIDVVMRSRKSKPKVAAAGNVTGKTTENNSNRGYNGDGDDDEYV